MTMAGNKIIIQKKRNLRNFFDFAKGHWFLLALSWRHLTLPCPKKFKNPCSIPRYSSTVDRLLNPVLLVIGPLTLQSSRFVQKLSAYFCRLK